LATGRGIAIHNAVCSFLRTGDLDPQFFDYFDGIHDWLSHLDLETWWPEGLMRDDLNHLQQGPSAEIWYEKHRCIGIPDCVGKLGGVHAIIEFKTSDTLYRDNCDYKQSKQYTEWGKFHQAAMQLAAYANCWKETVGTEIEACIISLSAATKRMFNFLRYRETY
tara:strand:+ start:2597 stop:3088 length:492 start_codon:yes stop_codon:yes gene_type:complete